MGLTPRRLPGVLALILTVLLAASVMAPVAAQLPPEPPVSDDGPTVTPTTGDLPATEIPPTEVPPTEPPAPTATEPPPATETPTPTGIPATETPSPEPTPTPTGEPTASVTSSPTTTPTASPSPTSEPTFSAAAVTSAGFQVSSFETGPGSTIEVRFVVQTDGPTNGGAVSISAGSGATFAGSLFGTMTEPGTCTGNAGGGTQVTGQFETTGPGTCIFVGLVGIDAAAPVGSTITLTATTTWDDGSDLTSTATIAVAQTEPVSMSLDLSNADALPGDTVRVTARLDDPSGPAGSGQINVTLSPAPGPVSVVPGSAAIACEPDCRFATPPTVVDGLVVSTYGTAAAGTTVVLTFDILVHESAPPGPVLLTAGATLPNGAVVPVVSEALRIGQIATTVSAAFSAPSYPVNAGDRVTVTLTVTITGLVQNGTVQLSSHPLVAYGMATATPSGMPRPWCTVTGDGPAATGTFLQGLPMPGTSVCTYSLDVIVSPVADGSIPLSATVSSDGVAVTPSPQTALEVVPNDAPTLGLTVAPTTALPGSQVEVTATQVDPDGGPADTNSITVTVPAGLVIDRASVRYGCAPACPFAPSIRVTDTQVFASQQSPLATTTATLQFTVAVPAGLESGSYDFRATGTVGPGYPPTGPAVATLTVETPDLPDYAVDVVTLTPRPEVPAGSAVAGTVTFANIGAVTLDEQVTMTASISGGVMSNPVLTCQAAGEAVCPTIVPGATSVTYSDPAGFPAGGSLTFAFAATAGEAGGVIELAANVEVGSGDWNPSNNSDRLETAVVAPAPLAATDQALDVAFEGRVEGALGASGGLPPLRFAIASQPAKGTVTLDDATGAFTYTAGLGQTGQDTFTFAATDSSDAAQRDEGTVTLTIAPPSPGPYTLTIAPERVTASPGEDVLVTVHLGDPQPPLASSGAFIASVPAGTTLVPGSLGLACVPCAEPWTSEQVSGTVFDDPAIGAGWRPEIGAQPFTSATLTYRVSIDTGTAPGTVLTFRAAAGVPSIGMTSEFVAASLVVVAPPVVAYDQALDVPYAERVDGSLSATGGVSPYTFAVTEDPTRGRVALDPVTGVFTYTADIGQTGVDRLAYRVTDADGATDTGEVTFTIGDLPTPTEAPPTATATSTEVPPTATEVPPTATATPTEISPTATATVTAVPPTVTATSTPILPALTVTTATFALTAGDALQGSLAGQVSGGVPPYTFALASPPGQGTAIINPDGTFTYSAGPGAAGNDRFTYAVTDREPATNAGAAASTTGTVVVRIDVPDQTPSPTPPRPESTPTVTPTTVPGVDTPVATATHEPATTTPVGPGPSEAPPSVPAGAETSVTRLPSTGRGSDDERTSTVFLLAMLVAGMVLLASSVRWSRKR